MNIINQLHYIRDAYAEKTAVVSVDGEWTYEGLYDEVDRYAEALRNAGVGEGDRFNILMVNSNRMLSILLAGWQIGAIPAPINIRLGDETVRFMVEDAESGLVVIDEPLSDKKAAVEEMDGVDALITSDEGGELEAHLPDGDVDSEVTPRLNTEHAIFLHTAGTTGRPKWVQLTHGNLAASLGVTTAAGLDASDSCLHYFPLYHSGGIDVTLYRLLSGGTTLLGSGWDPEDALQRLDKYDAKGFNAVPQMGYELVNHPDFEEYDLSSVEYFWVGGDTVSEELANEFREIGAQPMQGYGLTETMAVIAVTEYGKTDYPLDSTGEVVEDIAHVRIVDPDTGEEVETGEIGEIMITGDKLAPGYHNRPEKEAEAYEDGWLHTEDLGMIDENGYLYITGRLDNMMIVGGENVYPTDVEETLEQHPAISQVVVVAKPDARKGQIPVANIVLEEGADITAEEIKQWFIEQDAAFKHPREIRFLDELPTTALGKIDRTALQEEIEEEAE